MKMKLSMKSRSKVKKTAALVLSTSMLLGLAPAIPDVTIKAKAAGKIAQPSVEAYVEKSVLSGNTLTPKFVHHNPYIVRDNALWYERGKIAKLKLGKDENGDIQEWLLLGKDSTVAGDNTAVLAVDPIISNSNGVSACDWSKRYYVEWQGDEDGKYSSSISKGTKLYRTHYGISPARAVMKQMAQSDSQYFKQSELNLLQPTTVSTYDSLNKKWYETTDVFYSPDIILEYNDSVKESFNDEYEVLESTVFIGGESDSAGGGIPVFYDSLDGYYLGEPDNDDRLPRTPYVSNLPSGDTGGSYFRLYGLYCRRNFFREVYSYRMVVATSYAVWTYSNTDPLFTDYEVSIVPASNINLTNVSFASAAKAAQSETAIGGSIITSGTDQEAMTLRLDGAKTGTNIGSFEYNEDGIAVKLGDTEADVSLVVQGNNGTNDWYFSKKITKSGETVSVSDIAATINKDQETAVVSEADIKLADDNCKIWLEVPTEEESSVSVAVDKTTGGKLHKHTYAYGDIKATPSELMWNDHKEHYWICLADLCPDREKSKQDESSHNWVDTADKVNAEKDNLDKYKTGDSQYKANYETGKCEKTTTYYVYCSDCERIDEPRRTFAYAEPTEHVYNTTTDNPDGWIRDEDGHLKHCTNCGEDIDKGPHTYETDEDGNPGRYCTTCGYDRKHEHDMKEHRVEAKDPTCTEPGNYPYYECSDEHCEVISEDAMGIIKLTISDVTRPAKGHKASGYKYDEYEHWKVCENINNDEVCGAIFDKAPHTYINGRCICGSVKSGDNNGSSDNGNNSSGGDDSTKNTDRYNWGSDSGSSGGGSGGGGGSSSGSGMSFVNGGTSTTTNDGRTPGTAIDGNSGGSGSGGGNGSGWEHDGHGWKYKLPTGQYAAGTSETGPDGNTIAHALFVKIDGAIWAFGADEYLIVGWVQDAEGKWWYIDIDTGLLLGWIYDTSDSNWYYCNESNGMLTGWFYDTEASYWYYLDPESGAMHTGWQTIDGKQYYLAPEPPARTYSFDALTSFWYYDNTFGYRPYGSLYVSTTTPDNRQVDANGAAM